MKKTIIVPVILVSTIVLLGIFYFVFKNNLSAPASNPVPLIQDNQNTSLPAQKDIVTNTPATPESSKNIIVDIKNFSFSPSMLTVKAGTKVTWVNNDNAPHTITSDSDNLLNSDTLSTGQSFSFIFTNSGSVNYHCAVHPSMKGSVAVIK